MRSRVFRETLLSICFFSAAPVLAVAQNLCPYSLVTFQSPTGVRYGLDTASNSTVPSQVWDVTQEIRQAAPDVNTSQGRTAFFSKSLAEKLMRLQCALERGEENVAERLVEISRDEILPAIPQPVNIVALGLNSRSHAQELGKEAADGFIFPKNLPLSGAYADIVRPAKSLLDYEVELGVVFRLPVIVGMQITPANVTQLIAGFVLTNDVSNRAPIALDKFNGSFTLAKTYPTFLPVGPVFVPIERFLPNGNDLIPNLPMQLSVQSPGLEEEIRQRGMTNEGFFRDLAAAVREALANRDQFTLGANGQRQKLLQHGGFEAGDLLLLGTLGGTALRLRASQVLAYSRNADDFVPGEAFNYFWPAYSRYFPNYGGPFPINQMPQWMALKSHWVRQEYCNNSLYLAPGQIVTNSIEQLGTQINLIVADNDDATAEEARVLADPARYARLCIPQSDARPDLFPGTAMSTLVSGGLGAAGWHHAGGIGPWWLRYSARGVITLTALLHSAFQYTRLAWAEEGPLLPAQRHQAEISARPGLVDYQLFLFGTPSR